MKQLLIALLLFLWLGFIESCCKGIACFTPPPEVDCIVVDRSGNELLNPATANHFDTSKIQVFKVENGQRTLQKLFYYPYQNKIHIICSGTWFLNDKENQMQIQLDSTTTETLTYTLVEVNSKCCTYFEYGKKAINGSVVDKTNVFTIVK